MNRTDRLEWEKPYVEALIQALRPQGNVLEVGFDQGYAAAYIQTFRPQNHTIIESDALIASNALKWASNYTNVTIIHDVWQNALPHLGVFDAIFFNAVPRTIEIWENKERGIHMLSKGKEILSLVQEKIPQLTSIRYADSDIDAFYEQVGQFHIKELSCFLHELKYNKQITEEQYEDRIQKYNLKKPEFKDTLLIEKSTTSGTFTFLKACLDKHMHKGSRFSCFSNNPTSNFENPQFFADIITNPHFDYQEQFMPVTSPLSYENYTCDKALVMVIEKLS